MPEVRAFRGVRFTPDAPMKDVVCPPYDVISPSEQQALHERHEHNAVRLELPVAEADDKTARYRKAAAQFSEWTSSGVLVAEDVPALYVYRQDYETPAGTRGRVAGVIGALELVPWGQGVLPHERTMPGPIEDRLALMRACPVNISPIYTIYRGAGSLTPFLESLGHRPTDARFQDDSGTLHRLWVIKAPAEVEMLTAALRPGPLVIADGHHRYETALAFHEERADVPGGHGSVMCFCVDADAEGLVVDSFQRVVKTASTPEDVKERLIAGFESRPVEGDAKEILAGSDADHPFLFRFPSGDVLVELSEKDVLVATGERAPAWRKLDVVALHEVLLPELAGADARLVFTKEPSELTRLMSEEDFTFGVVLRPPSATDVIDVATAGERMPQKASYFWPKAITGLVFRDLES